MKKKILSIILATLMIVALLPMTAFAATTHDFTVTKNDGTSAVEDTDYEWSGNKLNIYSSGLTVTGTTTHNHIDINDGVENVTIKNLTANYGNGFYDCAIEFYCNSEIILEGNNTFSGVEGDSKAFCSFYDLTISGSGNMNATFPSGCIMLMSNASLTLKCSGNIVLDSSEYYGLYVDGDLNVDSLTGKVLVYGDYNDFGAIGQFNSFTLGEGLAIKGDAAYKTAEDAITGDINWVGATDTLYANGNAAKSVLITVPKYKVFIAEGIENGTLTVDKTTAKEGETVTVTATPNKGYVAKELECWVPENHKKVVIKGNTFVMPDCYVVVSCSFEPEATETPTNTAEPEKKSPKTGDADNLWIMLFALSSIGLCACLVLGNNKKYFK